MTNKLLLSAFFLIAYSGIAVGEKAQMVTFSISLEDESTNLVKDGVFLFTPQFELNQSQMPSYQPAIMNQVDKQFVPHVLVVPSGTEVTFPNADNLFHHVYSFSPTKQFELKLYKEFTAQPLRFEKAGIVDIGCNIHDWMLGYIVVSDSPYFGKTNEQGQTDIVLPVGEYQVSFWHPQVDGEQAFSTRSVSVSSDTRKQWKLTATIESDDDFDFGFGDY